MAQPRFQLRVVRRRAEADPDGRRLVADSRPVGHDDRIVWRLLGANNRELGRSGDQFGSIDDCLRQIERLRHHFGAPGGVAPTLASSGEGAFLWWWTVRAGTDVLASAARSFSRQVECLKNFETFASTVLVATVADPIPPPTAGRRAFDPQGVT